MTDIFSKASAAWSGMDNYRAERARCKRYVYGDQWGDWINVNGKWLTEAQLLSTNGQLPLKNNILRRILRNVVGLYRSQYKVPLLSSKECGLKGQQLKKFNRKRLRWFKENRMEELAPRLLEEFLISGIAAVKVDGDRILPVTPDNFFFYSDGYDPRGGDVDLIGEVHRVSFATLIGKFCKSPDDYRRMAEFYDPSTREAGDCRLIEVWHKEIRLLEMIHDESRGALRIIPLHSPDYTPSRYLKTQQPKNLKTQQPNNPTTQILTRTTWRCRWFAHDGTLLRESGPMAEHPYVFKAYPYIDGEIHSYISDIIDQQRYVNRLISLYDMIMRSSAKGVLLFPEESIPAGMDLQEVAEEWSRFNGVISFRAKPGVPLPTQVSTNSTNIGIADLLKIEMQMLEDISGVSPTLQGKLVTNSTSGTLFAQQNEAAQTSLLDILRSFNEFLQQLMERRFPGCQ